jgi:hypothetical protein
MGRHFAPPVLIREHCCQGSSGMVRVPSTIERSSVQPRLCCNQLQNTHVMLGRGTTPPQLELTFLSSASIVVVASRSNEDFSRRR